VRFSIGEFARHGRVSVRMLRHYDAIGLLRPACVDPVTGYRSYEVSQLAELNRLIALKDLGFRTTCSPPSRRWRGGSTPTVTAPPVTRAR
jgi:MerR family regulatory protein